MASSRDSILAAVRSHRLSPAPLPEEFDRGIRYEDPYRQFETALAAVGGRLIEAASPQQAHQSLLELPHVAAARHVTSLVPGIGKTTVDEASVTDPHQLEHVDLAVLPGAFAVAENAAVWFPAEAVRHRVLPFIAQHLVLVVPAHEIVHNLHEAYERLDFLLNQPEADGSTLHLIPRQGFGVFISGPSKTADIEQSLVIGAHGPRSLTVVLLRAEPHRARKFQDEHDPAGPEQAEGLSAGPETTPDASGRDPAGP
ncbi:MAG: lactate utilization protein C [Pirellulaceae bacterium]